MKYFLKFSLLLLLPLIFFNCKKKDHTKVGESDKKEVAESKFAKYYPNFDFAILKDSLKSNMALNTQLQSLYEETGYNPIWVHDTLDIQRLHSFIDILNRAEEHGLSSDMFSTTEIIRMTNAIDSGLYTNNLDTIYKIVLALEETSTLSAIKYITGMQYGFTNPRKMFKKDYDITIQSADSVFYKNLYTSIKADPIAAILASHPKDDIYLKLQQEYKLLSEDKEKGFSEINSGNTTFKLGDKSKHIKEIADRLTLTGEYIADSTSVDSIHMQLDEHLLAAVNLFRRKNSYPEEPEIGPLTISALNKPINHYITKIQANMERYRWKKVKGKHSKNIDVNVASAMLVATQQDSLPLIMRVCVGSVRNKTPLLQSDISYMNLNPYWNVPTSIAQKEVAVLQKKDPTYIKRHNMKLFKGGKEVDVNSIDWKDVNPGKFSYTIRQEPGYGNSLGLIKFMFNNAFSVYLHDTPSKAAFNRKNRAISHGCVRVQKPFDLALFCAGDSSEKYLDQLYYSVGKPVVSDTGKALLKSQKLTKLPNIINIDNNKKISLFIDYYTVYTYPNDDMLYYADDPYDYDKLILEELSSSINKKI